MSATWQRVETGHYYTRLRNTAGLHHVHAQLIDSKWHLRVDGVFRGSYATYSDTKLAAARVIAEGTN